MVRVVSFAIFLACWCGLVACQDGALKPCDLRTDCINGATCTRTGIFIQDYYCTCAIGFRGRHCEVRLCGDSGLAAPMSGMRTPPSAVNSSVQYFNASDVLQYSCTVGYSLMGASVLGCQTDGTWNGTQPTCKPIVCPYPTTTPTNGVLSPASGSSQSPTLAYNTTVTLSCNSGYRLQGSAMQRCQLNGQLSGNLGTCVDADFCSTATCPVDTDPTNTTWTSCCRFLGKSVQCCKPGVQDILNDRYRNITNPTCVHDLHSQGLFGPCISSLITCLSNAKLNGGRLACPDIHGCQRHRNSTRSCVSFFGTGAMLCNSTIFEQGTASLTTFCLPPSCQTSLVELARSDFDMNCRLLTELGKQTSCPILRSEIQCPGGNGTFDVGGQPPKGPGDDSGIKPGILALIIIMVIVGILALVGVFVFIYRHRVKASDTVDFARLRNQDDDVDADDES